MASINISIKEDAYKFLKSLKSKDESFSDVILGFKDDVKKGNIIRFFGVLKDTDWNTKEKRMHEFREDFEEHFK